MKSGLIVSAFCFSFILWNHDSKAQVKVYSKNNLSVEVTVINPCDSASTNGAIIFKLLNSKSGRAILVLVSNISTTIFPGYELNLTNQNTFTYRPDLPQSGLYDFVIRDPDSNNDFINTSSATSAGVELKPPPPIIIKESEQTLIAATCFGASDGSITLSANGGGGNLSYSLDNGANYQASPSFQNLAAGLYPVITKDQNGCFGEIMLEITQPEILVISPVTSSISCNGSADGKIEIKATGGTPDYQYSFNGGQSFETENVISSLTPGIYGLLVKDKSNCTSNLISITLTDPSAINLSATKSDATLCEPGNDGSILVTASGGSGIISYSITGTEFQTSAQFNSVKGGTYNVTVRDENGCKKSIPITVGLPDGPSLQYNSQNLSCFENKSGVINITGTGGTSPLQYSTNGGTTYQDSGNFSGLSAGSFRLVVKDKKGCKSEITASISQPAEIIPKPIITPVICNGESNATISITATGGLSNYQYSIDNGIIFENSGKFTNLGPGTYPLVVRDGQGCFSKILQINLDNPPAIKITSIIKEATCADNDGSIQLGVTGGVAPLTYEFNNIKYNTLPSGGIFIGLKNGTYLFKTTDSRGCSVQENFLVSFPGRVNATASFTPADCDNKGTNATITVNLISIGNFEAGLSLNPPASPQSFIQVQAGTFSFTNLKNGNYSITIKNNTTLCPAIIPVTISGGPDPVTFQPEIIEKICAEDRSFIRLNNIVGSRFIDFKAEIKKSNSIYKTQIIPALQAALRPVEIEIPDGGDFELTLSQNQSPVSPCINPITAPVVPFKMETPGGVLGIEEVQKTISFPDLPTGSISGKVIESLEEPYQTRLELIDPNQAGQSYLSDFEILTRDEGNGEFNFIYSRIYSGKYELTIKDAFGCVKKFPLSVDFDPRIFIPNIFTPDGDGINDEFFIRNLPPNSKLDVTDSWGQNVFSTLNYKNDWKAENSPNGIYYYSLLIGNKNYNGWVEILTGK